MLQGIPLLAQKYLGSANEKSEELYQKLQSGFSKGFGMYEIGDNIYKLGAVSVKALTDKKFSALASFLKSVPSTEKRFSHPFHIPGAK